MTMKKAKYNLVSLFAGIGGFELGFKSNAKTILMCEIDKVAQHVLKSNLPSVPVVDDIRDLQKLPPSTDIVCAGFPCQDLSSVGIKKGLSGSRSSLINEVFRLLEVNPPEWVIIENVSFMLRLNRGEAINTITTELNRLGYKWAYRTIDSISFVPQHRCRVYVVASLNHDPRNVLLSDAYTNAGDSVDFNKFERPLGFYWKKKKNALGLISNGIPTLKAGSTIGIPSAPAIVYPSGEVFTPDICDAEKLQGFPVNWTLPAEEISKASIRWKLIGNAVTVDTIEWLAKKISKPKNYNSENDEPFISNNNWPKSAWSMGNGMYVSNTSLYPQKGQTNLEDYITHDKHSLSLKASTGFLKRLDSGGLKHPDYFRQTIIEHINSINI